LSHIGTATEKLPEYLTGFSQVDLLEAPRRARTPMKGLGARSAVAAWVPGPWIGRTEVIVVGSLGLVAQDIVGVLNLSELGLRLFIAWIAVGVVLPRQFAVGLLDFICTGITFDTQNLIIVLRHGL